MYARQYTAEAVASVALLVWHFVGRREIGDINVNNGSKGAWRAGVVWDACNKIRRLFPRGNRSTIRRELFVWVRNCNTSIEDFDGILLSSPRSDCNNGEDSDDKEEAKEPYAETEMVVVQVSVNKMKCSKNLLNPILTECKCIGECTNALSLLTNNEDNNKLATREGALWYIADLHKMTRLVREDLTNIGVLLYPLLDF